MKPEIPPELFKQATALAQPAIPAVIFAGKDPLTGKLNYQLIPPQGGHSLLDLYFCAIISSKCMEVAQLNATESAGNGELDVLTEFAWRLALSAVRTRPLHGAFPESMPAEWLE